MPGVGLYTASTRHTTQGKPSFLLSSLAVAALAEAPVNP